MWIACVVVVLDLAPPLVLGAALLIGRRRPWTWLAVAAFGIVIVAATIVAAQAGIVFRDPRVSLVWLSLMYVVYLVVAGCTILVRRKLVMIPLAALALAPMAFGYVLGTVGLLGLEWSVADILDPPSGVRRLQNGDVCEMSFWGMAGGGGTAITVYRDIPGFSFFRRQIARMAYSDDSGQQMSCADASVIAPL